MTGLLKKIIEYQVCWINNFRYSGGPYFVWTQKSYKIKGSLQNKVPLIFVYVQNKGSPTVVIFGMKNISQKSKFEYRLN